MKVLTVVAAYALVGVAVLATEDAGAEDGCTATLYVLNGLERNIRTTQGELGSLKSWHTVWEQEDLIEPGKSVRKLIQTGQSCTDESGKPRRWNVRVTRKNGKQHACEGISSDTKVTLKPGGGCDVVRKQGT